MPPNSTASTAAILAATVIGMTSIRYGDGVQHAASLPDALVPDVSDGLGVAPRDVAQATKIVDATDYAMIAATIERPRVPQAERHAGIER